MLLIVDQSISAATKATDKSYLIHWVSTTTLNQEGKPLQSLPLPTYLHCQHHPLNHKIDHPYN